MDMTSLGTALGRSLSPLLTPRLFYGAAISCVAGLALGAWLQPPAAKGLSPSSPSPIVQAPAAEMAEAETPPDFPMQQASAAESAQPVQAAPQTTTWAALSPPARRSAPVADPADDAQAPAPYPADAPRRTDRAFVGDQAASGYAWRDQRPHFADDPDWADAAPPPDPRWSRPPRDWAADDAQDRGDYDDEDMPPPPRWRGPPERRWAPYPQPRRDFAPDGPGYAPADEGDDGDG